MSNFDYDFFVIGAGSGGVRAGRVAAQLGAKVAVAEDLYLGGTCVNVGCVPKKLFVYAAQYRDEVAAAKGFGWDLETKGFDWRRLKDNKDVEIQRLNQIYDSLLNNAGAEVIRGRARMVAPHEVEVNGRRYTADKILIAVGGWPNKPSFPGSELCIDSNDVFHLEQLPRRILVQGGGYIAAEFAGIFNGLGCDTELVYRGPLFLRSFDEEVRDFIAQQMRVKGVKLQFNTDIVAIEKQHNGSLLVSLNNGETREVDAVFSAVGRKPKTEGLGLENTGVEVKANGEIAVDERFQTREANIYAVGDVVGRMQLTPVALAEGSALAKFLFDSQAVDIDYRNIATAIFTQPNIACVGYSEDEAQQRNLDYRVYRASFKALKQTLGGLQEKVLMKLLVDNATDKVIGAHMVGEAAGEIVQSIAVAIKAGATKKHFDDTIGIHPTAAEEFVTMRTAGEKYQSKIN